MSVVCLKSFAHGAAYLSSLLVHLQAQATTNAVLTTGGEPVHANGVTDGPDAPATNGTAAHVAQ